MRLQPASIDSQNTFTAYGDGYVSVNANRFSTNVIVLPQRLIPGWTSRKWSELCLEDMEFLASLETEIIILGTGNQLRFPPPDLMQPLALARKGLEVMDIHAACRTYNVLLSEGRKIAAALLFD